MYPKRNQQIHIRSLSLTKLADGLLNPKLVLAWLMTSLGAGAGLVGFLVPIREAGALLPQLFTAPKIRAVAHRKWWWTAGSAIQGVAVLGIVLVALFFTGTTAGVLILALLTILAIARSLSSVSYKDVLGKTIEKERRGHVTGTASSIAATGIFIFGALLVSAVLDKFTLVIGALSLAGLCWLGAGFYFSRLAEPASETPKRENENLVATYWNYLRHDAELRRFIIVRALLVATAVAPPFLILLANESSQGNNLPLGALVLASSLASIVSGTTWGTLTDRSTKAVLCITGVAAAAVLVAAVVLASAGVIGNAWYLAGVLFVLMVAYQGVRIARTIHLTNLASEDTRAGYTAISNTIMGIVLLATGLLGPLSTLIGISNTVLVLAAMSFVGGLIALRLQS